MPASSGSEGDATFRIRTPSRLHVTLIDMNGESGRLDGGIGITLSKPALEIEFRRSDHGLVRGRDGQVSIPLSQELARCADRLGVGSILEGRLVEEIPRHRGLGSGTQTHLALLAALDHAHGRGLAPAELIGLSARGGTSGIGTYAFFGGGFLVDGGHRRNGAKSGFLPSRFCPEVAAPPLLVRQRLPPAWRIVLFVPAAVRGLSGQAEKDFMVAHTPIPKAEVQAVSHVLLMGLLPALVEEDFELFADSIAELQEVGWKRRHWERPDLAPLRPVRDLFRQAGIGGCGLSSTGTTLFGFCPTEEEAAESAARLAALLARAGAPTGEVLVAAPNNEGMSLGVRAAAEG